MPDPTPTQVFARRLKRARENARLSQDELHHRLKVLGYKLSRSAIAQIELERRRVTLDDWLALAAALGVAPLHLVVPFEDEEPVIPPKANPDSEQFAVFNPGTSLRVAENVILIPLVARMWIKGVAIYPGADLRDNYRYYVGEVPPARRWEIEREWARREGREPGPRAVPEGKVPRMAVFGPEGIEGLEAPLYELLREEQEEEESES
jgi:transcriptional regulator with XRE-family HTH domain